MSNKHLFVVFFVAAMALWVFSGEWSNNTVDADEVVGLELVTTDDEMLVRGVRSEATQETIYLDVRGQTNANRVVRVTSEISGKITALPGEKGSFVDKGDLLCRIDVDARRDEYAQALAEVKSAQLEYDGFSDLKAKGLQSVILLAKAKATLEQSKTRARHAQLALEKTEIVAPFDGVVDSQPVEVGDYLSPGSICVTLIEIDPILVTGQVSEKNVNQIRLDDKVEVQLITGESFSGSVSYIGHAPDSATRTFPVEVTVDNKGADIRAGMTADMRVPVGTENIHVISPASLVLNDSGVVGVRLVDQSMTVRFLPVTIVNENPAGIWVKGLPSTIDLITVGQEEVFEGQVVKLDLTPIAELVRN